MEARFQLYYNRFQALSERARNQMVTVGYVVKSALSVLQKVGCLPG